MKRSSLPKMMAAAMMAGLSIAPTLAPVVPQVATVGNPASQRRDSAPAAVSLANVSAMNLPSLLGGSSWGVQLAPMWPHNRPQPGWRAVQSRRRHKQHMKRRRHNA